MREPGVRLFSGAARFAVFVAVCAALVTGFPGGGAIAAQAGRSASSGPALPYEMAEWTIPATEVDRITAKALGAKGYSLRRPASDEVFVRRVFLDMLGTPPTRAETEAFLADKRPGKRSALIESLFERDEFADYLSLKWGDLLRIKSEFPSNLWPNAVQAYHRWIREAVRTNMPYDRFARELLTSSGSNFRVPQVNFYRAISSRNPDSIAGAVSLTFMGTRFDSLSQSQKKDMSSFFSRVAYKRTLEWKEEIVFLDPKADAGGKYRLPDGRSVEVPSGSDPRVAFADWLVSPENPWFARAIVNRVWFWLMGTGIVEPADDFRPGNPPASAELLDFLARSLAESGYDLRGTYRLILNSRTYGQSSVAEGAEAGAEFSRYAIRRLDAESLVDALCAIGGAGERYSSPIPEPFTFIPREHRTIALADGSISSPFLVKFGRPARDTGLESERDNRATVDQALYLINSTELRRKIEGSPLLSPIYAMPKTARDEQIKALYITLLSRYPTALESRAAAEYMSKPNLSSKQVATDVAWALVNGKEFLYRH